MKQLKMKSLLWKTGLQVQKKQLPKKIKNKKCHQFFCQEYRKLVIVVVPCTSFFNKGTIICISHCVQVRFLSCTWWQKQLQKNLVRCSHESNKSEIKAVRNNSVVFSRCCHKEICQWLHMPLSLIILIWDIPVFLLLFVLFLSGGSTFLLSSWLKQNACLNYSNAFHAIHLLWIQVLFNLLFCFWFIFDFWLSVLIAIMRGKPSG